MSEQPAPKMASEQESREVAESARQTEWTAPSFMRELFLGNFRLDLIHPFPLVDQTQLRPEFVAFRDQMLAFLETEVDSNKIDETGEYGDDVIDGLVKLGAFGMKIPKEYGGLGFSQVEYNIMMELMGSYDANIVALLSAHQSIGVPQPVKLFGTEAQKKKYLPICAKGGISAFALTEPEVGSDPANLATTCVLDDDGEHYVINGEKLWCTNGTLATVMVVMARNPETRRISAFIVEADAPGITLLQRCRFVGHRAIGNAHLRFENVRIPKENLIGKEGAGLKIALVTLNAGRLSLPAGSVGVAKRCLEICRAWCNERVQWGLPIGKHEAIAHKLASMAATTFAMDAITQLASQMADRGGYDIRLEAAASKEWNTCRGWEILDDAMQIRGGRGYETDSSLMARGEQPDGLDRMLRDFRIYKIFEGSSEIMHLFMAREAVDKHLKVAGDIVDPKKSTGEKLAALPKIAAFYAVWYPTRWLGWGFWPKYSAFGKLAKHLRFCERATRKLARQFFHGMIVHQAKLERKQGFLFRGIDIGLELFAMASSVSRAQAMREQGHPEAERATRLADTFCKLSRAKVKRLFRELWWNADQAQYLLGTEVLKGEDAWMEKGLPHFQPTAATLEQPAPKPRKVTGEPAQPAA